MPGEKSEGIKIIVEMMELMFPVMPYYLLELHET